MEFATHYKRPETKYEPGGGRRLTESAGYLPAKFQIEQMILAGQRLAQARENMFDLKPEDEDGEVDPTRSGNYDLADASAAAMAIKSRAIRAERALRRKQIEKAAAEKAAAEKAAVEPQK